MDQESVQLLDKINYKLKVLIVQQNLAIHILYAVMNPIESQKKAAAQAWEEFEPFLEKEGNKVRSQ